ncbi:hypothetical protein J6O86_06075 [bacterium]|nr:hypothetical protein [bacterium]
MEKRWYEISPDVNLLIGNIESSFGDDRIKFAGKILLELKKAGYAFDAHKFDAKLKEYSMKRWYDYNKTVFYAFECLKDADRSLQGYIARNVHDYIMNFKQSKRVLPLAL